MLCDKHVKYDSYIKIHLYLECSLRQVRDTLTVL